MFKRLAVVFSLFFFSALSAHANELRVVASFSILADLAQQIGGQRVTVTALVSNNQDAHGYQPRPSDSRALAQADLALANGLGFDAWFERLAASANEKLPLVIASNGIQPLKNEEHDHHDHDEHAAHDHDKHDHDKHDHDKHDHDKHDHDKHDHAAHDHGEFDPHAWQSVANARIYVRNIADALTRIDSAGAADYAANLAAYEQKLDQLESEIKRFAAELAPAARTIVTNHDAFGYFGHAYGLRFIAPAGIATEAQVSAKAVAGLIQQIKAEKVRAIFVENISDERLMQQISNETGATIGGKLYSDALDEADHPAGTYLGMMQANLATFRQALIQ